MRCFTVSTKTTKTRCHMARSLPSSTNTNMSIQGWRYQCWRWHSIVIKNICSQPLLLHLRLYWSRNLCPAPNHCLTWYQIQRLWMTKHQWLRLVQYQMSANKALNANVNVVKGVVWWEPPSKQKSVRKIYRCS